MNTQASSKIHRLNAVRGPGLDIIHQSMEEGEHRFESGQVVHHRSDVNMQARNRKRDLFQQFDKPFRRYPELARLGSVADHFLPIKLLQIIATDIRIYPDHNRA